MHTWLQQSVPLQKVPLFLCAPRSGQVVGWEYGKLVASLENSGQLVTPIRDNMKAQATDSLLLSTIKYSFKVV